MQTDLRIHALSLQTAAAGRCVHVHSDRSITYVHTPRSFVLCFFLSKQPLVCTARMHHARIIAPQSKKRAARTDRHADARAAMNTRAHTPPTRPLRHQQTRSIDTHPATSISRPPSRVSSLSCVCVCVHVSVPFRSGRWIQKILCSFGPRKCRSQPASHGVR